MSQAAPLRGWALAVRRCGYRPRRVYFSVKVGDAQARAHLRRRVRAAAQRPQPAHHRPDDGDGPEHGERAAEVPRAGRVDFKVMTPTAEKPPRRVFNVARPGTELHLRIEADTVCEDGQQLLFRRGGAPVGRVSKPSRRRLRGWWVEDESFAGPYHGVELDKLVARFPFRRTKRRPEAGRVPLWRPGDNADLTRIYSPLIDGWWIGKLEGAGSP